MVCLGNICRSPLAEGILRKKLPNSFFIDSAGTSHFNVGSPPDKRSIKVATDYGIDITHLKSRQFSHKDFIDFDIIYAMDKSNYRNIIQLARNIQEKTKVKLLLSEIKTIPDKEVPDPYYAHSKEFKHVYDLLNTACNYIANKLIAAHE